MRCAVRSILAPQVLGSGSSVGRRLGLLAVCTVTLLFVAPVSAGADSGGAGVGAAPAPGAPGVLARGGYYAPTIRAGATWTSVLLVSNGDGKAMPVVVYAADGLTAYASGAVYSNLGQPLRAAGTWLMPTSQTILVKANGEMTVHFQVTVPTSAAPGDYLAGIVAQSGVPLRSGTGDLRVNLVTRAVVGVLIRVPGPASFDVKVGEPKVESGPEQIGEVVTPITDTGRVIGKPIDTVSLRGPKGYEKTLPRRVDTLLPGGTAHFPVYWPDRLHGLYEIKSCVSGAGLARTICSSAAVNIAGSTKTGGDQQRPKSTAVSPFRVPSWILAPVSAVVGCALAVGVMSLRRSRRHGVARRRRSAALVGRRD